MEGADGTREKDGEKLEFRITYINNFGPNSDSISLLQKQLRSGGIGSTQISGTVPEFQSSLSSNEYEFAWRNLLKVDSDVLRGDFFDVGARFPVPAVPPCHPVVLQAGDSEQGRDFAAGSADVIFTGHGSLDEGKAFYHDVKRRLPSFGRAEDDLKILPGVSVVLGDFEADAQERASELHRQQVSGSGALAFLEQVWGTDLSDYDPDGPLPRVEPNFAGASITRGRVRHVKDPIAIAEQWRTLAQKKKLSIRELVIDISARTSFVGTPTTVADQLSDFVQQRAADGFILVPSVTSGGVDEFVEHVIPELQDRGVYRRSYPGITLRENLGLPPHRPASQWAQYRVENSKVSTLS